ncbi:drug/metabolite transporter (DMT)-like permease [Vibrio sp. ES.051]|uniref:DMT family transporter n=1 Tax=Vibrio sp. ES.051 TaxID=1761909 RepID=UPI000BF86F0D|nr:DMT family transporter [Vibrio sp. ES.051]PFG56268.1 drug/metabolite transporter (DMT)-like permease [Vibrio sp. ES.051]
MTDSRLNVDVSASLTMVVVCFIWGMQQTAIKSIADDIAPVLQIGFRSFLGALLVWIVMTVKRNSLKQSKDYVISGIVVGTLFALEFLFVAEGLRYTSASHMTVFLYTAPIFAAVGLQLFNKNETLAGMQWFGIALAFSGIAVAFISRDEMNSHEMQDILRGDIMGLIAGSLWGATTVVVRCTRLGLASAEHTLFFQLGGAGLLLLSYAAVTDQLTFSLNYTVSINLFLQVIFVSFASYLAWFSLIRKYKASQLGVLSFMTPVIGVLAGIIILNEKAHAGFVWGAILILIGVMIVSVWPWLYLKIRARPTNS